MNLIVIMIMVVEVSVFVFAVALVMVMVVVVCVAVFVGFGWIAYDHHSIDDYLNDLKSGWRPRRAQAAYELSKILTADPDALADDPAASLAKSSMTWSTSTKTSL